MLALCYFLNYLGDLCLSNVCKSFAAVNVRDGEGKLFQNVNSFDFQLWYEYEPIKQRHEIKIGTKNEEMLLT